MFITNRKLIELWLFLSVLCLLYYCILAKYLSYAHRGNERNKDSSVLVKAVVPQLEKTAGETSRDDPKASRSSPPRENDMESLDIKDQNKASSVPVIGGVRRQLTVQDIVLSPENFIYGGISSQNKTELGTTPSFH